MSEKSNKFFLEKDALIFEKQLFNFWGKRSDKRWFWLAFQAIQNSGLIYYETEEQELQVRERIVLLAVIYNEYCLKSATHESQSFNYWSEKIINQINTDFSEKVNENLFKIRNALIDYFGNEEEVTNELWLSCHEGKENLILKRNILTSVITEPNINRERAEEWFKAYDKFDNIKEYDGISL